MTGSRAFHPAALRHRVLIVDDEERIRLVLARILRARGIAADAVADGADAVTRTVSGSYDLVILDLLMPGQDGFSALREIMRQRPDQAVLVLSCLSDPESKMASLGLGADDYVPKPFHVGELVARVQARLPAAARPGPPALCYRGLTLDLRAPPGPAGALLPGADARPAAPPGRHWGGPSAADEQGVPAAVGVDASAGRSSLQGRPAGPCLGRCDGLRVQRGRRVRAAAALPARPGCDHDRAR